MDSSYSSIENSYSSIDNLTNSTKDLRKLDISISEQLASFGRLRISALTKAAEISPLIKDVTIGPRSPLKKERIIQDTQQYSKPEKVINLLEDKLGDGDLRHSLLVKKYEAKLQETSQDLFRNLIERMMTNHAEAMDTYWKRQHDESQRKTLELRVRKLQMIKQLRESDNMSVLEEAKLDEQRCQLINRQTLENMNRILAEQNKATARFAQITDSHTKICICYNEIISIIESDELAKDIGLKHMTSLNDILSNMSDIMNLCKSGEITDKKVQQSEVLAINMKNIKEKIMLDLNTAKTEQTKKMQEEELRIKQEEEKKAEETELLKKQQEVQQTKKSGPQFYSDSNYAYYLELQNYLTEYEAKYKQLLEDSSLKKFKFDCQKAVNTPINALSSVSGTHMRNTLEKLAKLLRGDKVEISDSYISASLHPQGLYYCNALLAKKIVRQGELLVSSKPEAAFPLAALAVALWVEFPEFGRLLEAYFHRQCPYLVPMFLPQKQGQTDREFYLSRGYIYNDDNIVEKQDKFLKRMSGIFRLRCAIWIAKTPSFISASNPHSLRYGWKWLASFINLKPEPDICATLLHDFFNVCGAEFYKYYGKQFTKIIKIVSTEYLAILQNIDEGGPKTRLEVFLQTVLQSGTIPPPSGLLPSNLW
ncbi:mRNA export factor Gle1 [Pieris rapae]|uniref:mRNA export factor Gle1 n=1 Tax=Pieris rapae TaxID=64459 RepID=UPI000B928CDE|nr:mRNA export factor Gle1 [Pieris rapae]